MDYVLCHHGVKGMKWGVRRYRNPDGSLTAAGKKRYSGNGDPTKRKTRAKKIAVTAASVATVAACAIAYSKNKSAVDSFVKRSVSKLTESAKTAKMTAKAVRSANEYHYVKNHKSKILNSPRQILKYKDKYQDIITKEDYTNSMKKFAEEKALHAAEIDRIQRGTKYVNAIVAYATAATTIYNLKNTPLVKDATTKNKKKN